MKKLALGLFLVGCGHPQVELVTATPTPVVVVASPTSTPTPTKPDDVTVLTGNHADLGLTIQTRIDLLMAHLIASGKKRMTASWDVFPQGDGTYEVSYVISTIQKSVAAQASSTPEDNRAPREGGKARPDPFSKPTRPKLPDDAIVLTWVVNPTTNTYLPKDARTKALLALAPQLDAQGIEGVLPDKWRTSGVTSVVEPTSTESTEKAAREPKPLVTPQAPTLPPERMPSVEPQAQRNTIPIKFEGFIGSGSDRKAIFSKGKEHVSLGLGGSISGYKIKSLAEDEVVLKRGSDVNRLIPGQTWDPQQ